MHVVDLKTGEDRLVDKGINPRWANQHNWLFFCHFTGDGNPPYVHVNPRHPVIMMRAKHPEDGPFGTNRALLDLGGGNVRQGAVMLEKGHMCWRGDGDYLLFGNRRLEFENGRLRKRT